MLPKMGYAQIDYIDGGAVKRKPKKERPANRNKLPGLLLAQTRAETKFPRIPATLMKRQMEYIAGWPAFHITGETAEKLKKINPAHNAAFIAPLSEKYQ
jgi:hypothetical protein